ncbi:hypothetical protein WMY93_006310 [Mugilogobius chulae]|uniref:C-type lectin domain-containing protein n=1 Tax=Mugilogobius chulae TaxID=88201 RepID=A0AAW0PJM7_9GOBI
MDILVTTDIHKGKKLEIWREAQSHCRTYYTDLAFVNNDSDYELLLAAGPTNPRGWIGLYRDPQNASLWRWSGAGEMTYHNWSHNQPNNFEGDQWQWLNAAPLKFETPHLISPCPLQDRCGAINSHGALQSWDYNLSQWLWSGGGQMTFHNWDQNQPDDLTETKKMKMSWEKALDHCRQSNQNLASFSSDTELLQFLSELPVNQNEHVWVNMRFLGDRWMTVEQGSSKEQVWAKEWSLNECPMENRCAVLKNNGELDDWDCEDELYFMCK